MEQRRLSAESQGRGSGPSAFGPKKRPLTAVTPIGIIQQRKRRTPMKPPASRKQQSASKLAKPQQPESTDQTRDKPEEANESDDEKEMHDSENEDMTLVRQSKEEVGELWEQMDDEQRQRYSAYRQTMLNKGTIKKLVSQILGQQASSTLTFVVAGFSKVFVGDIVERAVQIRMERGEQGPLLPEHLREAYRQYKTEHPETSSFSRRLF
ncbi:transcription initiation factor TFIID subunit 11 [Coemansia brasiliensis]|uniref:Transcription initiation factor TFIID subunit 11 n=1 Tax=Coemansia brasiliensis TaxID=2650707 RepID=A0A9W8IEB2_9FUNG|nr:transcription initiation factor TFIID subunit 11 [Coemansia brasiliensis]